MIRAERSALPGFGAAMAITLAWVSKLVLVSLVLRPWELGVAGVWRPGTSPSVWRLCRVAATPPLGKYDRVWRGCWI